MLDIGERQIFIKRTTPSISTMPRILKKIGLRKGGFAGWPTIAVNSRQIRGAQDPWQTPFRTHKPFGTIRHVLYSRYFWFCVILCHLLYSCDECAIN